MKKHLFTLYFTFFALLAAGCSSNYSFKPEQDYVANPASGTAVKIVAVTDKRVFVKNPPEACYPSLKDGSPSNIRMTSRAVGRKRTSFGMGLDNIMLPEHQTVASLTKHTVSNGLRRAGYRVLNESDPGYASAKPIRLQIKKFWTWMNPGAVQVKFSFDSEVVASGDIPGLQKGQKFGGKEVYKTMLGTNSTWFETIEKGLDALQDDIERKMR